MNEVSSLHLICIGVDPAVISYILTRPEAAHFTLDICRSTSDAKEKIAASIYDVYLINLDLTEAETFSLINEIHKKDVKQATIAVIVDSHPDESYIRMLKEEKKVGYILEKPSIQQHIEAMLKEIVESKISNKTPYVSKMPELKRKYDATIKEKIAHLTELAISSRQNPDNIKELRMEIHKISGSAGSFGYGQVSDICKAMEIEMNERIASNTYKDPEWISSLSSFIQKVREGFQISSFEESPVVSPHSIGTKPLLYVVEDDVNFLELLERIKEAFSIDLIVEFDPHKALQQLRSPDFNPNGIVAAQTFRSSSITGLELIHTQAKKKSASTLISALLLDKDSIDIRVDAMQKGADYVFGKPVSAYLLLKSMAEALEAKPLRAIKVLIVDDDVDFCNYVSAVLEDIGISTCIIHESTDLFNKLEEFRPNILLLDILLPKYDGLNLLKTLRQDIGYKNLIIVLVTSGEQLDTRVNAYTASADDILFKPIDKSILQKRILSIAERRVSEHESHDNYTGLLHLPELKEELNELLKKPYRIESYLALFEVHKFSEWTKQNGYGPAKDLMIFISNQLQWESDNQMKCFWYKSSIFAIVFEGFEIDIIEKKMYSFLTHLQQNESKWHLSFNCAIVPISKNLGSASNILQSAEECLANASLKDPAPVKIVHRLPGGEKDVKREVVIVDPNPDLLKILKQAFESHGLSVTTYLEGGDALKDLFALTENHLPSLIIVERKLPDMDGMDLYLKLKNRFRTTIPFFMLTVFSADKDVSDGIRQGILEYIIKPFNISILVQKALHAIYQK